MSEQPECKGSPDQQRAYPAKALAAAERAHQAIKDGKYSDALIAMRDLK